MQLQQQLAVYSNLVNQLKFFEEYLFVCFILGVWSQVYPLSRVLLLSFPEWNFRVAAGLRGLLYRVIGLPGGKEGKKSAVFQLRLK